MKTHSSSQDVGVTSHDEHEAYKGTRLSDTSPVAGKKAKFREKNVRLLD